MFNLGIAYGAKVGLKLRLSKYVMKLLVEFCFIGLHSSVYGKFKELVGEIKYAFANHGYCHRLSNHKFVTSLLYKISLFFFVL